MGTLPHKELIQPTGIAGSPASFHPLVPGEGMCQAEPCPLHTCSRESMVKEPAVGFMHATYWQLRMSFRVSLFLSYLCRDQHCDTFPRDRDRFPHRAVPL